MGQGWNGGVLLANGGLKIWKNNETIESSRIETLWDTVHKGIPRVTLLGKKRRGRGGEKCDVWAGPRIKRCKRKG